MARPFRLRFPDERAIAELLEAEAPAIAALGEPTLPLDEHRALLETFLVYANRVQAWVDRLIPRIRPDAAEEPLPPPGREGH